MDEPYRASGHMSNNAENDPIQTFGSGLPECLDRVYLKKQWLALPFISRENQKTTDVLQMTTHLLYSCFIRYDKEPCMKYSEFKRWLTQQGVEFQPGKGSHLIASINGKQTTVPYHGSKEIGEGLRRKIQKDLGL